MSDGPSVMRCLARAVVLAAAGIGLLTATAVPASAHTVSGSGSTNFRTTLTAVTPRMAGAQISVVENGSRVELTNVSRTDVVVDGYSGEPYLRVGPDGVFENLRSTATYLNRTRDGRTPIPSIADDTAAPRWQRTSSGRTVVWHDHRTHWMGTGNPPLVAADPGAFHHVFDWHLTLSYGGMPVTVTGRLDWIPGPSPGPWFTLIVVIGAGVVLVAFSRRTWGPGLGVALAGLVAVDVAHSTGIALDRAGGAGAVWHTFWTGNAVQLAVWTACLVTSVMLVRRRTDGLWAAAISGPFLTLADGLPDSGVLYRSSAPFAGSIGLARTLTAITIGLGLGLLVACVIAIHRHDRPSPVPPIQATGAGNGGSSLPVAPSGVGQ